MPGHYTSGGQKELDISTSLSMGPELPHSKPSRLTSEMFEVMILSNI
jgi:hypothetical protein